MERGAVRWFKRILTYAGIVIGLSAALWLGFFLIYVHPSPGRVADPLDQVAGKPPFAEPRMAVVDDLLFRLDEAVVDLPRLDEGRAALAPLEFVTDFPYAPGAPAKVALSVTQGKHAMLLEQRNALYLPTPGRIAYAVTVPAGGRLLFGASIMSRIGDVESSPVSFTVAVDGDPIETFTLAPEPTFPHSETEFWYHTVGKFVNIVVDFFNGRWYDYAVDLAPWEGRRVAISFAAETADGSSAHGFIATPRIVAPDSAPDKPNVVVFVLDTLRGDHVGAVDETAAGITPNIDAIAAEGIAFADVRSQANWSRGSYQSMFLGLSPPRLGYGHRWSFSHEERAVFYKRDLRPLPDEMRKIGYTTVTVGNNPFTYDGSLVGVHLGFDQAVDIQREPYDTEFSTREAIRWLAENGDRRFFMMFTLNTPHSPFRPPFRYLPQAFAPTVNHQSILYRGAVAYGDDYFGKFVAALKTLGLYDNTVILVTGDHGVVLDRRGGIKGCAECGFEEILATHTHTLTEEENRVPLVIAGPGVKRGGVNRTNRMALLDLAPTVARLTGTPLSDGWSGIAADDLLTGVADPARAAMRDARIVDAEGGEVWMMTTPDGKKYLRRGLAMARVMAPGASSPATIREQVYDLVADPTERNDLSGVDPATTLALRERFDADYPRHRTIGKATVRGVDDIDGVTLEVTTGGRFVFVDTVVAEGNDGTTVDVAAPGPGRRIVTIAGLKSEARIFFETIPDTAPVTVTIVSVDGATGASARRRLRAGPLGLRAPGPSLTYVPVDAWSLTDPYRLADERADEDGVYFVVAPFYTWRAAAAAAVRLDPELEAMMKKWGYL